MALINGINTNRFKLGSLFCQLLLRNNVLTVITMITLRINCQVSVLAFIHHQLQHFVGVMKW